MLQVYDVFVASVDDDLSRVIITRFLVLHYNLVLARFDKARKAVDIFTALLLPLLDLTFRETFATLDLLGQ